MIEYPYYLHVKILSRGKGHHALKAAAYRSGQKLLSNAPLSEEFNQNDDQSAKERIGEIYDYSRRHGVMSSFIEAPKGAPAWVHNRQSLWGKVEATEKRVDAQIAREVVVSLPAVEIFNHLSQENKRKRLQEFYEKILRSYVKDNFTSEGMIADVALHEPSGQSHHKHYHAHIMLSMRTLDGNEFGTKQREWNDPALSESWRRDWSFKVNDALKSHKVAAFIDERSYAERGLAIAPTKPLGMRNFELESAGVPTQAGNDNRRITEENKAGHHYLERVFEFSPFAPQAEILASIAKEGFADPQEIKEQMVKDGLLQPLHSAETGLLSGLYAYAPMTRRADELRAFADALHRRKGFALSADLIEEMTKKRGDKLVREALDYTAQGDGFAVIETADNGHKRTYLSSCHAMYKQAGYDVIAVARNNEGKAGLEAAGFKKGVLTYKDLLRRFGERYTGAKSKTKKVIVMDEADCLSPLQDQEIFKIARKIGAKVIYLGSPKIKARGSWQSLFAYYKQRTAFKKLREKIINAQKTSLAIREAFISGQTRKALELQRRAKYLHAHKNAAQTKEALLEDWFKGLKKKDDVRYILAGSDADSAFFNAHIQKKRLEKKHLKAHQSKMFSLAYKGQDQKELRRDVSVHWGDMIQFKKSYTEHGIESGTRARVLMHLYDVTILELDDGRRIKLNLKEHNGFDLGYAGGIVSRTGQSLEQGYLYHTQGQAPDDAPLLYQSSTKPVKLFYTADGLQNLDVLSAQLLGRRHGLFEAFEQTAGFYEANDNDAEEDLEHEDNQDHNRTAALD